MSYRLWPNHPGQEIERLTETGVLRSNMVLERDGETPLPVLVRPVVGDAEDSWVPGLAEAIGTARGVVAFSGTDMEEAASIAADAAAWLGDRGKSLVLVDGSIERPVLGKALPEDGDEGLVDAVLFGVSPEVVTRRTLSTGVRAVTAGSYPLSIQEVFDGPALPRVLNALAEENLVVLLISPVHLFKVAALLSAAVCVARDSANIESLARSIDDVRTVGILVREPDALAPHPQVEGEPNKERAEAERPTGELVEEPAELERPAATREEPAEELSAEPAEVPVEEPADEPVQEPEEEPVEEPSEKPSVVPAEEPVPRPVTAEVLDASQPIDPARPEEALHEHHPDPPLEKRHSGIAVSVAVVVVLAIGWWLLDGQHRFAAETTGPLDRQGELAVDRTGSESEASREAAEGLVEDGSAHIEGADGEASDSPTQVRVVTEGDPDVGQPATVVEDHGEEIRGPGGRYRVMISSHYRQVSAELEAVELAARGVVCEVVSADLGERGVWHRVVVSGGYPRLADARSVLDTIKSFGYEGAWIERAPATDSD